MPVGTPMDVGALARHPSADKRDAVRVRRAGGRVHDVFDRVADRIIHVTGSPAVLGAATLFEIGWLAAGKPAKFSNGWQLVMSDVSTIAVFCMNPVLQNAENGHAREQQASFAEAVDVARQYAEKIQQDLATPVIEAHTPDAPTITRSGFDRGAAWVSRQVGSAGFFIGCLVSLGAWAGLGKPMYWSNAWQLILNSATSAFELPAVLTLHNTKLRDDMELAQLLRAETTATRADAQAMGYGRVTAAPNASAAAEGLLKRGIRYVARMEGSPAAIAVQVGLVLAWPGLGPVMHWGDNWQLVLGTTTSIASYVFLLVLMHTHHQHVRRIGSQTTAMVTHTEGALARVHPGHATAARAAFATSAPRPGIAARLTTACHHGAASVTGVLVGCGVIGVWGLTKIFLNFTTWMLVINSATMVAQTLAFVLIMNAHHRASAHVRRHLTYHATLRQALADPPHATLAATTPRPVSPTHHR